MRDQQSGAVLSSRVLGGGGEIGGKAGSTVGEPLSGRRSPTNVRLAPIRATKGYFRALEASNLRCRVVIITTINIVLSEWS